MKKRTIEKVINKHFDNFLSSIENEEVKELISQNTIITGGCIASMLMQEEPNDFDMYFRNIETVRAVAHYYVDQFKKLYPEKVKVDLYVKGCVDDFGEDRIKIVAKSSGVVSSQDNDKKYEYFEMRPENEAGEYLDNVVDGEQYMNDVAVAIAATAAPSDDEKKDEADKHKTKKFHPVFLSSNAITLSNRVQLITRFYGEPGNIHDNYDFVHCTNYWDSKERKVVLNTDALESILTKELKYVGSKYPLASLVRMRKFIRRGWMIHAGQILKIAMQVSNFDLTNPVVLEDQLTGVDVSYFHELITTMRKENRNIDSVYISELIERIM